MVKRIIFTVLIAVAIIGCKSSDDNSANSFNGFAKSTAEGAYIDGSPILALDLNNHQTSFDESRLIFRIQNDAQDVYLHMVLSEKPTVVSKQMTIKVVTKGVNKISTGVYDVEVTKIQDGKVWLYNYSDRIGFVVPQFR